MAASRKTERQSPHPNTMLTPRESTESLLRQYYVTFNKGDREALLAMLTETVKHDINQGGCEVGLRAFRVFLERMDRCYRERVEDTEIFASADGKRGAAEFYISGSYITTDEGLPSATGQVYRLRVSAFFDIIDGKIDRVTNYYNLEEWLRLVGG